MLTQIPHQRPEDILPRSGRHLDTMVNFAGMLEYLMSWVWREEGVVETASGCIFDTASLPLLLDDRGEPQALSCSGAGERVFQQEKERSLHPEEEEQSACKINPAGSTVKVSRSFSPFFFTFHCCTFNTVL